MGKAGRSRELPELLIKNARIIGKEVVKKGCIVVTGSCMGVANIAAKAASEEGGLILGYSPAKNLKEHIEPPISYPKPAETEIPIFTGTGKMGRNVLSITECDGIIIVGGGIGTLTEFSTAYHEGKIIGILEGVGGIIEKIMALEKDLKSGTAKAFEAMIVKDKNPKKLVGRVIEEIKKREERPRKEVPITFKNARGKELSGVLHLPEKDYNPPTSSEVPAEGRRVAGGSESHSSLRSEWAPKPPIVIICHGFQGTKTQKKYVKVARSLREEGILVFRFDFEGCGDSEGNPRDLTIANEVSDLEIAVKTVLKDCDVDSNRMAFIGDSLGAVVASLYAQKNNIKTLVFWSPVFNQRELLKGWYSKDDIKAIKKNKVVYKKEKEIAKDYYLENKNKDYSHILSGFSFPILIVHGTKDEDAPIEYSQKLAQKYPNITLKPLREANHKIDNVLLQEKLVNITTKWLGKYLPR